ncbi:MAG: CpaF family protein [Methanobrevibacter sp.]|nr:CpaF family protein [Methanobrevibacter sp.]
MKTEEMNTNIVPQYKIVKPKFSLFEESLLGEIRNNIVDLAISSGGDFNLDENDFLDSIKRFIDLKLPNESINSVVGDEFDNVDFYVENDADAALVRRKYIESLANRFFQEIVGYGQLDPLIKDDDLEEIMVIGVDKPVFVYHRDLGMMESDLLFKDEKDILTLIELIARGINRRIDQQSPILDGRLADGSRINATIPPISADGPTLTIRKFKKDPLTIIDLINLKTLDSDLAAFFWLCVDGLGVKPANLIISGGTSSGKTTTLNSLTGFINPRERIITIEDTLELQISHKHILRMETRPKNIEHSGELTMDDLVKNSLRQRPDRIIVGEVRGQEAITLFTALNTGHSGFGTLHANNSRETITRLINHPMNVPKIMISAIDLIVMQNRIYRSDGVSFRRITEVSEVVGMEEDTIQLNKIFSWNPKTDKIENVSVSSKTLRNIAEIRGINMNKIEEEIKARKIVLDFLIKNNLRSNSEIAEVFQMYYQDKEDLFEKIAINNDNNFN